MTTKTMRVLLLLAITLSQGAIGADNTIEVHGLSHHYGARKGEYNERNLGLGYLRSINRDLAVGVHAYENSYSQRAFLDQPAKRRIAIAAVAEYTPIHFGDVALGAGAGLVAGYPMCGVCPGGYLLGRVNIGQASVAVRGVPRIPNITRGIVAASVGWSF